MSVHLLKGRDGSLLGAAVSDLVHRLVGDADRSLVVDEFDGEDYELARVIDAAQTPPFLADRRVVVARGIERFAVGESASEDLAALVRYLADPLPTTALVLTQSGGRLPKTVLDALKQAGAEVIDTDPGTGRARQHWMDEQLAGAGVRLDPGARQAIVERLGDDLGRLGPVLAVLEAAYGPGARVTADQVLPFLGEAGDVPPWELTDAIDRGDTAKALATLRRMQRGGGRHALQLMAVLHGHYQRMLQLDGSDASSEQEAAGLLGLKGSTYQARKALDQLRRLGHDGLVRAVQLLADADLDLRGRSGLPDEIVLEVLVGRLSRLAPPARPGVRPRGR